MKKILGIYVIVASIVFTSCRNTDDNADDKAETKVNTPDTLQKKPADTVMAKVQPPEKKLPKGGTTRSIGPASSSGNHDKNAILANIDQYLVTKLAYPDPGTVTLENTLTDITIQKAYIEVNIVKDDGQTRTDYYILINIEPGDSKVVTITNPVKGTKASSHVVKLKSNELTDGELISVGIKFAPK